MPNKSGKIIFSALIFCVSLILSPVIKPASAQQAATDIRETETKAIPAPKPKPLVYSRRLKAPLSKVYKQLFNALENNGYFVVFEANIGKNLSHFAQRWGKNYNKNKLDAIRSMVFCNASYANEVSNADPRLLALCPLHVTLIHQRGITSILFVQPGKVAQGSAAHAVALELEQDIVRIIKEISIR